MQFVDLQTQYKKIKSDVDARIQKVLDSGQFILGKEHNELEEKLAAFIGCKHCIAMSSGTDALLAAMMALDIKPGDEVITSPFSFFATAESIALLGAKPVFIDIDPKTYNIDPTKIEQAITKKTKLILPVSIYGQCADFDAINAIAKKHNLPVVEDAAQSFGATYKTKMSCNLSTISCTSFFPTKPLGCYGDGGACFTNDDNLAKIMKEIRVHGQDRRYNHPRLGINGRLDTIQAAILLAKMEIFQQEIELRNEVANNYTKLLQAKLRTPYIEPFNYSVYAQYTVEVENRDHIQNELQKQGVPTVVHYPISIHKQPVFAEQYKNIALPVTEKVADKVMSLPMHPYLSKQDIAFVCEKLLALC